MIKNVFGWFYTTIWDMEAKGLNMNVGGPPVYVKQILNKQRVFNTLIVVVLLILIVLLLLSCAPTVPVVNGHQYLGMVTQITDAPAFTQVRLDNGTDYVTIDSVAIGDYVYRNRYGQLKLISPK